MAKSELRNLYERIIQTGTKQEYFSDSIDFAAVIDRFKNIENQDCPDGLILIEDIVYIVEHFQISFYWDGNMDRLQRALNGKNTKKLGREICFVDNHDGWEDQLLDKWMAAFSQSLKEHLNHYNIYKDAAQKQYPNMLYKFIIVVEDNSNSIVTYDNLCILDIVEFVDDILSYDKIDGVVVFNTSTLGNSIIAKDRTHLIADKDSGKLHEVSSCNIISVIKKICIDELTPEQRFDLKERICQILVNLKENIVFEENIQIEKKE